MPFLLLYFKFIFKGNSCKKLFLAGLTIIFHNCLELHSTKTFVGNFPFLKNGFTETLKHPPPQPKSTKHDESFLLMLSKLKIFFMIHIYSFGTLATRSELATGNLHL